MLKKKESTSAESYPQNPINPVRANFDRSNNRRREHNNPRRGKANIVVAVGIDGLKFPGSQVTYVGGSTVDFIDAKGDRHTFPTALTMISWIKPKPRQ